MEGHLDVGRSVDHVIVGDDISVLRIDDSGSRALGDILSDPEVGGYCLSGDGHHGIFIPCDYFLKRENASCGLGQVVVGGLDRLIYCCASECGHREGVCRSSDESR